MKARMLFELAIAVLSPVLIAPSTLSQVKAPNAADSRSNQHSTGLNQASYVRIGGVDQWIQRVGRLRYGVLECESRNRLLAACQRRSCLRNGTAVVSTKSLSMLPVPCSPTWTRFKRDLRDDARSAQRQSGSEYRPGSGEAR